MDIVAGIGGGSFLDLSRGVYLFVKDDATVPYPTYDGARCLTQPSIPFRICPTLG